jgi:hypothetical protein
VVIDLGQVADSLKLGLQEVLMTEPVASVRRAASTAVAVIARTANPAGEWPTLLPWLHQCTQSANDAHRETALVLLCSLTDTIGEVHSKHAVATGCFLRRVLINDQPLHVGPDSS